MKPTLTRNAMKDLTKRFIKDNNTTLRGSPTIYNPRSSTANYKGFLKAEKKIPQGLYYQPAQSSPTGSINSETIPRSFLPKDDPRRLLYEKSPLGNDPIKNKFDSNLDFNVLTGNNSNKLEKSYHLKPDQIKQIQQLRNENPTLYSRSKLAKMFNVSPLFISLCSKPPKSHLDEMDRRLNVIKGKWNERTKLARDDRKKRKELWYRA
ncbi:mitochondrial 54S ribosomal protein mL58 NDAI_0A03200 [Naumovozyma dairenensis CBS 421]|uniref:Uncharacterized protein n=1 Tax=Naumovozyma dairenensis (strain ATCC 10597 / BCRC 20456 / CBS 421 / NBRC 0211 / NRRL Y-12639) TaxID=1071378 RepID=G0W3T9_NAUDC|nr:hypothetical protein NDAI_0A03200 [Naumovozyma dairenensis CBS 421]CCD22477.1 hypothetical protein NDAI_0A03200 [Naumovozyma dairenensis CBS 421]